MNPLNKAYKKGMYILIILHFKNITGHSPNKKKDMRVPA